MPQVRRAIGRIRPGPTTPPTDQAKLSSRSNTVWTEEQDNILFAARARNQNWNDIRDRYFPEKTPNACRKRHERIRMMREADEFRQGGSKFAELASAYCEYREQMWSSFAKESGFDDINWEILERRVRLSMLHLILANLASRSLKPA
jgi:hypothetical protein